MLIFDIIFILNTNKYQFSASNKITIVYYIKLVHDSIIFADGFMTFAHDKIKSYNKHISILLLLLSIIII